MSLKFDIDSMSNPSMHVPAGHVAFISLIFAIDSMSNTSMHVPAGHVAFVSLIFAIDSMSNPSMHVPAGHVAFISLIFAIDSMSNTSIHVPAGHVQLAARRKLTGAAGAAGPATSQAHTKYFCLKAVPSAQCVLVPRVAKMSVGLCAWCGGARNECDRDWRTMRAFCH